MERASQEEHNGANFSFIVPSNEECRVQKVPAQATGKGRHCSDFRTNAHNSALEGDMQLKQASLDFSFQLL